jgi:hypothetical protein
VGGHVRMRRHRRPGQRDRLIVAVDVVGVTMGVDDVRDREVLFAGAIHQHFRRVRRVDQHRMPGLTIAQQVAEVAIAARAYLFEHELHDWAILVRPESVHTLQSLIA